MCRCTGYQKTKYKFICCVLWLYDGFDDGNDNESIEIYNLHASSHVRSSIPVRSFRWLECAENFKWKFIVPLSARRFIRFCVQWACWLEHGVCPVHWQTRNSLTALIKATSTASLRLDEWKIWTHNRLFILAHRHMRAVCGWMRRSAYGIAIRG